MKRKFRAVFAIFSTCSLLCACGSSGGGAAEIVDTEVAATLEQTLDNYLQANIGDNGPGIAILVMQNGETIYSGQKGLADEIGSQIITANSGFELASMSKVFTGIAIMQLYEQGSLSFNDSILDYMPELPQSWSNITVHHLLTHQSGIPDWINDIDFYSWPDGVTNHDVIEYFSVHDELNLFPGTGAQYSNTGYIFLSEIVGRMAGVSFADYMRVNVFEPLGMNNSYIHDETAIANTATALNFAKYTTQFERILYVNGPSGMVSSANDLQKFISAILNNQIVQSASLSLMMTHHTLSMDAIGANHYGYGMVLEPSNNDVFLHGGSMDGFETEIRVNVTGGGAVILLGNDGRGHQGRVINLVNEFFD
jgi:D-alanyl-D-alanine carboxypeptidase